MDKQQNVVSFTGVKGLSDRITVLDFLKNLSLDSNLHLQLPTMPEDTDLLAYGNFVAEEIFNEADTLIKGMSEVDPSLFKAVADAIRVGYKDHSPIRLVFDLTCVAKDGSRYDELTEIIAVYEPMTNKYAVMNWYINRESLFIILTNDYLIPSVEEFTATYQ